MKAGSVSSGAGRRAGGLAALGLVAALVLDGGRALATSGHARAAGTVLISIDSVRVIEGDTGSVDAVFTVRLSAPLGYLDGTLRFASEDRTAQADSDYVPTSGLLTLNGPGLSYAIVVPVLGDPIVEGNERFAVRLSDPPPGTAFTDSIGICTIVNDERTRFGLSSAGLMRFSPGELGPAFADANGDGLPDLPLDINAGGRMFYPSLGLSARIIPGHHHGCAWGDYDRDGRPDLVVMPYSVESDTLVPLQLLHNLGHDTYEDVAAALGMDVVGCGETAVWGDFDGDGWPDLFAPFYAYLPPHRCFLFRNNHDGTFTEMAVAAGVALAEVPEGLKPEGAAAADWNGDGTLDLYCASHLFLNDGAGHFSDVRQQVGLPEVFDEGAKFVDFDNDGDLDLFLRTGSGPRLFRNDGGTFTEVTEAAGLPRRPMTWGDSWADVDNDGDLDLLLDSYPDPAELYLNQGDGTFVADSAFAVPGFINVLSAWADVDDDGDLDAAFGQSNRQLLVNVLDRQPGAGRGWLRVWVLDADSLADCYGAVARLTEIEGGPGTTQTRVVDGGSGYLAQDWYPLHFAGLGNAHYSLEVRYPGPPGAATVVDGTVNPMLADLVPDQLPYHHLFVFRDGRAMVGPIGGPGVLAVAPERPAPGRLGAPWPVPARSRVTVPFRLDGRGRAELSVHDLSGRRVRTLARELAGDGPHALAWDLGDEHGDPCPSGVYFVRMAVDGRTSARRRIVVLR